MIHDLLVYRSTILMLSPPYQPQLYWTISVAQRQHKAAYPLILAYRKGLLKVNSCESEGLGTKECVKPWLRKYDVFFKQANWCGLQLFITKRNRKFGSTYNQRVLPGQRVLGPKRMRGWYLVYKNTGGDVRLENLKKHPALEWNSQNDTLSWEKFLKMIGYLVRD